MKGIRREPWEVSVLRNAGKRLAEVSLGLREVIRSGVSLLELDEVAERHTLKLGCRPAFKGYRIGDNVFPATICVSLNEEVVHGIPSHRLLVDGDVLSVDMGLVFGGYFADHAFTVVIGECDPRIRELLDATEKSLYMGIEAATCGGRIGDIGFSIQSFIDPLGFGIVRDYVGHGVGRALHEPPSVPNFGKKGRGLLLKEGMCLAIEPMITLGSAQTTVMDDGWTVVTNDKSIAAHFEHTIVVTPKGPEILTTLDC